MRNLRVHWSDDESVLVYSKVLDAPFTGTGRADRLIVVANVDPHSVRETLVHLDLAELGLEPGARFRVRELITGAEWTWTDTNYVRLDAFTEPVHILSVEEVAAMTGRSADTLDPGLVAQLADGSHPRPARLARSASGRRRGSRCACCARSPSRSR